MKRKLNNLFLGGILIVCFLLSACKKDMPKGVIKPAEMENLLYDYHLAKAASEDLPYDERYKQTLYMEYVFKKHHTTEAVFDSSLVWYTRNTDKLSKMYENINKRFKSQQESLDNLIAQRDNKPKMSAPGDSIDVWYQKRLYKLTNSIASNKLLFEIPTDTNFKERDRLVWKMRYHFMPSRKMDKDSAYMLMAIVYENDSSINSEKKITVSGLDSIALMSDSAYKIKEIRGAIYYPGQTAEKMLLVDKISLVRYHRPELLKDTLNVSATDSLNTQPVKEEEAKEKKDTLKKEAVDSIGMTGPTRRSPREMREGRQPVNQNKNLRVKPKG